MSKGKIIGCILAIIVFIIAILWYTGMIPGWLEGNKNDDIADSAIIETMPTEPEIEDEEEPAYVSPIDFEYLWSINQHVVGWVKIPGVNDYLEKGYPILWDPNQWLNSKTGQYEDFYLHHDIDGNYSAGGAIYLDSDDKPDFTSLHNITYGHHMKNGSMYRDIVKFKEESFFNEHRDVYIYTPTKEYHLKTLACLYTDASGEKRKTIFTDKTEFDEYVDRMTSKCTYRDLPTDGIKQLWSFVTCSYEFNDARTILYCYEVDEDGNKVEPDATLYLEQGVTDDMRNTNAQEMHASLYNATDVKLDDEDSSTQAQTESVSE